MVELIPGSHVFVTELTKMRLGMIEGGNQAVGILLGMLFTNEQLVNGTPSCNNPELHGNHQVRDLRLTDAIFFRNLLQKCDYPHGFVHANSGQSFISHMKVSSRADDGNLGPIRMRVFHACTTAKLPCAEFKCQDSEREWVSECPIHMRVFHACTTGKLPCAR